MKIFDEVFKAYDVRGLYPSQINEGLAYKIGVAFATVRQPKKVAVGRDVRASGEPLKKELIRGLVSAGVNVVDIGIITTDQLYFAVGNYGFDGGISVTASHNPGDYNGFKFAEKGGAPIGSGDLVKLRDYVGSGQVPPKTKDGELSNLNVLGDYVNHVLSFIDPEIIKPLAILGNANFGAVGRAVDIIAEKLNLDLTRLNWQEDGTFPKGSPNPLLPENRDETISKIKSAKVDFGVAWDADADRVFFFTADGEFVPSAYTIALLARGLLAKSPGAKIVHDLTTSWVIRDTVVKTGGIDIANRTGHTFIKQRMREEDAIFAGESSGHYYFKDSFYADNGIVPFLLILQMISQTGQSLTDLVSPFMESYKVSGEINFKVANPQAEVKKIEAKYGRLGKVDKTDGIVVETKDWRFSVRPSNTEPLFRLNAEAHDQEVLENLVSHITADINT